MGGWDYIRDKPVLLAQTNERNRLKRAMAPEEQKEDWKQKAKARYAATREKTLAELRTKREELKKSLKRFCLFCHEPIPPEADVRRKYCNDNCRSKAGILAKEIRIAALPQDEQESWKVKEQERKRLWKIEHAEEIRVREIYRYHHNPEAHALAVKRSERYRLKSSERKREYGKARHLILRKSVIEAYGNQCQCCGEQTLEFLAIDHINGNGVAHRKSLKVNGISSGAVFYRWLQKNDYPNYFQVLCHNCNMAKGFYGICSHQKIK